MLYLIKAFWTPRIYTATEFTDKEEEAIISILGDEFSDVHIDGLVFKHARDTVNIFYVSNVDEDIIEKNYRYSKDAWEYTLDNEKVSTRLYRNENLDLWIDCYVYQTSTDTKAIIYIEGYFDELYKIARN